MQTEYSGTNYAKHYGTDETILVVIFVMIENAYYKLNCIQNKSSEKFSSL